MAHPIVLRGEGHGGPKGTVEVEVKWVPSHSLTDEQLAAEVIRLRKLTEEMYEGYSYDYGGHG